MFRILRSFMIGGAFSIALAATSTKGFAGSTSNATASVTLLPLSSVSAIVDAQLLFSSAPGVLTLSIPGSSGSGSTTGGTDASGTPVFSFSSADGSGPGLTQLAELALSDGTLAGGQGVSLALSGGEGETVVAVVAYN